MWKTLLNMWISRKIKGKQSTFSTGRLWKTYFEVKNVIKCIVEITNHIPLLLSQKHNIHFNTQGIFFCISRLFRSVILSLKRKFRTYERRSLPILFSRYLQKAHNENSYHSAEHQPCNKPSHKVFHLQYMSRALLLYRPSYFIFSERKKIIPTQIIFPEIY